MTDSFRPDGIDAVPVKAAEAAQALEALKEPAERAAADGEVTLAELARAVLNAVNAAAGSRGKGGLSDAISAVMNSFGGTRAEGGPVLGGGAYLVGERGPEVFRPAGAGSIEALGGMAGVTVNLSVDGGAQGLLRSEAQIARMLARATALGARRM